jgi:nicotinate phosphoribosyltransferase
MIHMSLLRMWLSSCASTPANSRSVRRLRRPKRKRSEGKATWPGRKQVFRQYDSAGTMSGNLLTLEDDSAAGEALIVPVLRDGRRLESFPSLDQARVHAAAELARLPVALRGTDPRETYEVTVSSDLKQLAESTDRATARKD